MTNEPCTDCRIAISPKGIEVDNSSGDLLLEAGVLVGVLVLVSLLYIGKKIVDKRLRSQK